jgi:copper ion binding protein
MAKTVETLDIGGMSCQHCVHAVKTAVSALAGVDTVDVSLEKNNVTVGFDPQKTGLPSIRAAIEGEGYSVAKA